MRKTFITLFLALCATVVFSQGYKHSFGVIAGTLDGISYKCYGKRNNRFAFQFDAYWQWGCMPKGVMFDYSVTGNAKYFTEQTYISNSPKAQYQAGMASFSFMYQKQFATTANGIWNWYVGAGIALGGCWGYDMDKVAYDFRPNNKDFPWLKFDQHALGGVEYCYDKVPFSFGIDLRPAMAENFQYKGVGKNRDEVYTLAFDWGVNLSVRYCFGN